MPIAEISPIPGPSKMAPGRSRPARRESRKQTSFIMTATPMKLQLEGTERHRDRKRRYKPVEVDALVVEKKSRSARNILFLISVNEVAKPKRGAKNQTEDLCCNCAEFGRDNEMWFCCVSCSG
ncbi:hypothetical protein PR048_016371 [Dryococelus australis]|uniref:Uncharacterized protein n=1 Tax=Dryococelus australis TaxID=614101 RepID=A0ABQ9HJZ8_9NEOP|nr:hypothetical protein PR048_016371 [Dryococelus australis]